ncbi:MAG: ATP-binding protein [Acholeplasmataceae bacterium]|jgi:AAA+ ATPase superfamily predicted ATPase|nr:ATP-binding protein [Acholeplasmataceae bacterium]
MFIGRKEEIKQLIKFLNSDRQENIVIYGRRRIGKSELIKEVLNQINKPFIFYQAKETTLEDNVDSLGKLITAHFKLGLLKFTSLESIFDFIFSQGNDIILVIDEYPYLTALEKGLDSILQSCIDLNKNKSTLKLVLLGSYIDIMSKLNELDNPLYGRISSMMFIGEMNYQDASLFYSNVELDTKVKYYSVFGGVPYYNSLIDSNKSFKDNMIDLIIRNNSQLGDFIEMTLSKELRKLNNANMVFTAIAGGKTKFNDILSIFSTTMSSAALTYVLNDLIKMDLIHKQIPMNEPINSRKTYYEIKDNFIDFYYRYIYKFASSKNVLSPSDFYDEVIKEDFESKYVPKKFEKIAKEYLIIQNKQGLIKPVLLDLGKVWFDNPREKTNGEFDLVSKDKQGYIIYEVKYTDKSIKEDVLNKLKYQIDLSKLEYYKIGLISKNGLNIQNPENYYLKTLKDLYTF